MSKGMKVQEIFGNSALNKNQTFSHENQENKQQFQMSKKKTLAPLPPMLKFGGYKPKILGGQTDFVEVDHGVESVANTSGKSRPAPAPPQLTKPKPWVIGDKDTPMVLGTVDDNEDDDINANDFQNSNDDNNNIEEKLNDMHIYSTIITNGDNKVTNNVNDDIHQTISLSSISDTATLIPENDQQSLHGIDNPLAYSTTSLTSNPNSAETYPSSIANSISFTPVMNGNTETHATDQHDEPEGVFIPAPDYDEMERTMEFTSEDTDDPSDGGDGGRGVGEDEMRKKKQIKPRLATREYAGADLSHYLSDDEDDLLRGSPAQGPYTSSGSKRSSTQGRPQKDIRQMKVSDAHSLFKPKTNQNTSKHKRKSSAKNPAPTFNSVRNFSYADSKFGTIKKTLSKSYSELNDSEMFLNASDQQSSYESFLRSRHGDMLPPESSDSGIDVWDDGSHKPQMRQKEDTVWKKLTLRLKHRKSKNYEM